MLSDVDGGIRCVLYPIVSTCALDTGSEGVARTFVVGDVGSEVELWSLYWP